MQPAFVGSLERRRVTHDKGDLTVRICCILMYSYTKQGESQNEQCEHRSTKTKTIYSVGESTLHNTRSFDINIKPATCLRSDIPLQFG